MDLVLVSGGPDSLVLAEDYAGAGAAFLHVAYSHPAAEHEAAAVAKWATRRGVDVFTAAVPMIATQLGDGNGPCVVPARNLVLVALAGNFAAAIGASRVLLGACAADFEYPDCNEEFAKAASALLNPWGVEVCLPLVQVDKAAILRRANELGILAESWSCYRPSADRPCGDCSSCLWRAIQ